MTDRLDLQRFLEAQEGVYELAFAELKRGRKSSHWIWFIFPQIAGLGSSPMASRYAIRSLDEARAYLHHPLLGARLRECSALLVARRGTPIEQIMGWPDDLKLKSSMTLFSRAAAEPVSLDEDAVFKQVLDTFFNGELDSLTIQRL